MQSASSIATARAANSATVFFRVCQRVHVIKSWTNFLTTPDAPSAGRNVWSKMSAFRFACKRLLDSFAVHCRFVWHGVVVGVAFSFVFSSAHHQTPFPSSLHMSGPAFLIAPAFASPPGCPFQCLSIFRFCEQK